MDCARYSMSYELYLASTDCVDSVEMGNVVVTLVSSSQYSTLGENVFAGSAMLIEYLAPWPMPVVLNWPDRSVSALMFSTSVS